MKLIRSYFLIIARHAIFSGLIVGIIISTLVYLITGTSSTLFWLILSAVISTANYLVVKRKVTIPIDNPSVIVLAHYPDATKIVTTPFWGLVPLSEIVLPDDDWKDLNDRSIDTIIIKLERPIKEDIRANFTLLLYLYFSGPFQAEDLAKCLEIDTKAIQKTKTFSLEDRIEEMFELANKNNYTEALEKLYEGDVKKSQLKKMIIHSTIIPDFGLSNLKTVGVAVKWFELEKNKNIND
jgi:hypothetical protein